MLLVIQTKDGYWLAADGVRSGEGQKIGEVCKVHQSKYGLVLKAGAAQGFRTTGEDYSTDTTVRNLLESANNPLSFMASTKMQFLRDLTEELAYTSHNPAATPETLPQNLFQNPVSEAFTNDTERELVFLDLQDGSEPIRYLAVVGSSDSLPNTNLGSVYQYAAQARFDWQDINTLVLAPGKRRNPPGVHMFVDSVDYAKGNDWIQAHPKRAALEMLKRGHSDHPELVGPPYTIVHVTFSVQDGGPQKASFYGKGKVTWVERGKCPSWEEEVRPNPWKDKY